MKKEAGGIKREVKKIVARAAGIKPSELKPASDLAGLGVDSFAFLEIVAEVEKKFKVFIPDEDLGSIKTVADLDKVIEKYAGK